MVFGHLLELKLQYFSPERFWTVFRLRGQPINVREQQGRCDAASSGRGGGGGSVQLSSVQFSSVYFGNQSTTYKQNGLAQKQRLNYSASPKENKNRKLSKDSSHRPRYHPAEERSDNLAVGHGRQQSWWGGGGGVRVMAEVKHH